MELRNIKIDEIEPFFDSLTREKELMRLPLKGILSSDFITGVRVNDKLAGIAGIVKTQPLIPSCFFLVKDEYQGKGFGSKLGRDVLEYAKGNYNYLTLYTMETKEYEPARHLYNKLGFRTFYPFYRKRIYQKLNQCWMCLYFNGKGKVICTFLPIIYPLSPYMSLLLSMRTPRQVYKRLFKRDKKKVLP